jgi:hypothetical protein
MPFDDTPTSMLSTVKPYTGAGARLIGLPCQFLRGLAPSILS